MEDQPTPDRAGITMDDLIALDIQPAGEEKETPEAPQKPVQTPRPTPTAVQATQRVTPESVLRERHTLRAGLAKEIFLELLRTRWKNATDSKALAPLIKTSFELSDAFQQQIDVDYVAALEQSGLTVAKPAEVISDDDDDD